jgi:glycosyltransferase involved in cell wall biosynthesis
MEKILSIIIPTYNMGELLPRCVDSLIDEAILDSLEIIIVNDGSKDNSIQIANAFKQNYPLSVVVVDKPNGNYGSTINAALPIAKGKYVKILDADDWYDTQALVDFIGELRLIDSDMVISHFTMVYASNKREIVKYNVYGREVYEYGKIYSVDTVLKDGYIRFFLMHAVAYRTDLLRDMQYKQTEGISYTDIEWVYYPLFFVDKIVFLNINLYQYNIGREGQTMDPKILNRSLKQIELVTNNIVTYFSQFNKQALSETRLSFIKQYLANRVRLLFKGYLLDMPRKDFNKEEFKGVYEKYTQLCANNELVEIKLFPVNKLLRIDCVRYWRKNQSRLPLLLEAINGMLDVIMTFFFSKIFKR